MLQHKRLFQQALSRSQHKSDQKPNVDPLLINPLPLIGIKIRPLKRRGLINHGSTFLYRLVEPQPHQRTLGFPIRGTIC